MVRVSSPAKLRPWSELTAKMVMGVVPGLVTFSFLNRRSLSHSDDGLSLLSTWQLMLILLRDPPRT